MKRESSSGSGSGQRSSGTRKDRELRRATSDGAGTTSSSSSRNTQDSYDQRDRHERSERRERNDRYERSERSERNERNERNERVVLERSSSASTAGGAITNTGARKLNGWGFGETSNLPTRPMSRDTSDQDGDEYGVVVSLKDVFGFIQPCLKEEQIYFSLRDLRAEICVGDIVRYRVRPSSRGLNAEGVRILPLSSAVTLSGLVTGTVIREPEPSRKIPGVATITSHNATDKQGNKVSLPEQISFVDGTAGSSPSPKSGSKRMVKGDEVRFEVIQIPGSGYMQGKNAVVSRTRKEFLMAQQVQRMLDAGASQEIGLVDTMKGDYGFIRPQNKKEQIYFRLSDVLDQEARVEENTEVSYFVIAESTKGGLSDRAVHLQILPVGTVRFEATIAEGVLGTVIVEPVKNPSREIPGRIRLCTPVLYPADFEGSRQFVAGADGASESFNEIELWMRCVPESLVLRVGDTVRINVVHYRPEQLVFARNLRVHAYRKLGREFGEVKSVRGQGYGFVTSTMRDYDLYFRTSEVIGSNGELMKDRDIVEGMFLSYDVIAEESSRGGAGSATGKLRGTRAAFISNPESIPQSALVTTTVEGVVQRDAKKDSVGVIRVTSSLDGLDIIGAACLPEIVEALDQFQSIPELKHVLLEHLTSSQRKLFYRALDFKFPELCHESADGGIRDGHKVVTLKIWKAASQEEAQTWQTRQASNGQSKSQRIKAIFAKATSVNFLKSDVNEGLGLVCKDLEVVFELHIDLKTGNFVAKEVLLTDKPYLANGDSTTRQLGVVQVVTGKSGSRFGFIRCIPSGQKLFWHESGLSSELRPAAVVDDEINDLRVAEGKEVSFLMRLKGGLPSAIDIKPLPPGSLNEEEVLDGTVLGVVVEDNKVVLLDVSGNAILSKQYWNGKLNDSGPVAATKDSAVVVVTSTGVSQEAVVSADDVAVTVSSLDISNAEGVEDTSFIADGADETDGAAAVGANDTSSSGAGEGKSFVKYFELLNRLPVPVSTRQTVESSLGVASNLLTLSDFKPGDLVYCSPIVNLGISRQPIAVCDLVAAANSSQIESINVRKSKGSIVRLKIRCNAASFDPRTAVQTIELCEVKETSRGAWLRVSVSPENDAPGGASFFCDVRDILKVAANNSTMSEYQHNLHLGDQVEYYAVSMNRGTALLVVSGVITVTPSVAPTPAAVNTDGISFRRNVNTTLKETLAKQGYKGIHMAQGPPDDNVSIGFKPDWRPQPDVSTLPWAHLLA